MRLPDRGRALRLTRVSSARQTALGVLAATLLVALNAAWVARALGPPPHRPREVLELDHRRYIAMAGELPGSSASAMAREAPFCWRILSPLLVYAATRAGLDLHLAYWASTMLFLILFLLALFRYLVTLGLDAAQALLGTTLASLMPGAVRWYAYQYWMPDPLCLFLVVLGLHLVQRRRHAALSLVALAGLLTRESWLLVIVYALVRWTRADGVRCALGRGLAVFGLPLRRLRHGAVLDRASRRPDAAGSGGGDARLPCAPSVREPALLRDARKLRRSGPAAARARGKHPRFARQHPEDVALVAMTYASLAFANNTDRLLVYALPVLIPASLRAINSLSREARLSTAGLMVAVLSLQALVYVQTPFRGRPGLSMLQPVQWTLIASLAGFWLLCVVAPRLGQVERRLSS